MSRFQVGLLFIMVDQIYVIKGETILIRSACTGFTTLTKWTELDLKTFRLMMILSF